MKFFAWLFARGDDETTTDSISAKNLRHHLRAECAQGVDLPTWRTPKEVNRLRQQEARQMRIVRKQA
jgi:hypothetical protein